MADRPPSFSGQMPSSFDEDRDLQNEPALHKVVRKVKEEPLIPLGVGLTVFAFINAYRAIRRGDSKQANRMFRARVAAQGFTVLAMVAGSLYYGRDREKTAELRKLREQRDSEEKRQKWIAELEARDNEQKERMSLILQKRKEVEEKRASEAQEATKSSTGSTGTGGIIGRMGLWSKSEENSLQDDANDAVAAEAASSKKPRKPNPNSSLGAIGEVVSANKKNSNSSQPKDEPSKAGPKS